MGNNASKKSGEKRKGKSSKRDKQSPVTDNHASVQPLSPPPAEPSAHVVTNREIQDAISRGTVLSFFLCTVFIGEIILLCTVLQYSRQHYSFALHFCAHNKMMTFVVVHKFP